MERRTQNSQAPWNPYFAGFGLGLTLLLSYAALGTGLGASGALARAGAAGAHAFAPQALESNPYTGAWFASGSPVEHYLVYMALGTLLGGAFSVAAAGRFRWSIERGPRASARLRLGFALLGGLLCGFASRMAGGCTSGQALSGGAMMQQGSWVFLAALFAAGFAIAPLARGQWRT